MAMDAVARRTRGDLEAMQRECAATLGPQREDHLGVAAMLLEAVSGSESQTPVAGDAGRLLRWDGGRAPGARREHAETGRGGARQARDAMKAAPWPALLTDLDALRDRYIAALKSTEGRDQGPVDAVRVCA
jgi:hypothetical protein